MLHINATSFMHMELQAEPRVELCCILNARPLTYKQYQAGPLVELHGVGLAELKHGPGVPGKEPALRVVQHLHAALSRDHVTLCVQQNQRGNTWGRRKEEVREKDKKKEGRGGKSVGGGLVISFQLSLHDADCSLSRWDLFCCVDVLDIFWTVFAPLVTSASLQLCLCFHSSCAFYLGAIV